LKQKESRHCWWQSIKNTACRHCSAKPRDCQRFFLVELKCFVFDILTPWHKRYIQRSHTNKDEKRVSSCGLPNQIYSPLDVRRWFSMRWRRRERYIKRYISSGGVDISSHKGLGLGAGTVSYWRSTGPVTWYYVVQLTVCMYATQRASHLNPSARGGVMFGGRRGTPSCCDHACSSAATNFRLYRTPSRWNGSSGTLWAVHPSRSGNYSVDVWNTMRCGQCAEKWRGGYAPQHYRVRKIKYSLILFPIFSATIWNNTVKLFFFHIHICTQLL